MNGQSNPSERTNLEKLG